MEYDLVIVGAGAAEISTAVEAREAGIASGRILVLEKGPAHSYAIRKYYLNRPTPAPATT
jgi:glycine/D-amino acid oxidase-like deaminating enzyme